MSDTLTGTGRTSRARSRLALPIMGLLLASSVPGRLQPQPQVRVANLVPLRLQDEEDNNSEATLTVRPGGLEIVASTHNLGALVCDNHTYGLLRSTDGGHVWGLSCVLPRPQNALRHGWWPTDITVSFGAASGTLFGSFEFLNRKTKDYDAQVFSASPNGTNDWGFAPYRPDIPAVDQPHFVAGALSSGDRIAMGIVEAYSSTAGCAGGIVYWNLSSGTLDPVCVATRSTFMNRTPIVRTAIGADGAMYALQYRARPTITEGFDVVLSHHAAGAAAGSPFMSLLDNPVSGGDVCNGHDGNVGYRIATCILVPTGLGGPANDFGRERRGYSQLALAVNPRNSDSVAVAWGDSAATSTSHMTLHVRVSSNGGQTWSADVNGATQNATNPALAIDADGRIGFAYQQLEGSDVVHNWNTRFVLITAAGSQPPITVVQTPGLQPTCCYAPFIGDFMDMVAVGRTFFGTFTSSGDGATGRYPNGVEYIRHRPGTTVIDPNGIPHTIVPSIDPYFFAITPR